MTDSFYDILKRCLQFIPWERELQPTLSASNVSMVLHEPSILAGYRLPNQRWLYYVKSLFQLHNETLNVWTHLIGALLIVHRLHIYSGEYDYLTDPHSWPVLAFGICSIMCDFTSSCVHLFHSKSPYIHYIAFMVDYIGATIYSFGSGMLLYYVQSDPHLYNIFGHWFLAIIAIVTVLNFLVLCGAKVYYGEDPSNLKRKYFFLGAMAFEFFTCSIPVVPRFIYCVQNDEDWASTAVECIVMTMFLFFLQSLAFSAHQPEKTWPGKFDIIGHGHQIFHILTVLTQMYQLGTAHYFNMQGLSSHTQPDLIMILITIHLIIATDVMILWILRTYVSKCLSKLQ
ncbi:hypothetical protein CHS0354_040703 [Potamilus streckersoni]|uniref:Uncharacterized protein n=1 Tax=Potamilus streckersoni TaxID=2493646 RepID=A0AAE0SLK4_9BIVA|nr:hypothetical protein CHS0354_040703 [Potamilus streckersoni]